MEQKARQIKKSIPILKEFRCWQCKRLLGKIDGDAEIVCPRCGRINVLSKSK